MNTLTDLTLAERLLISRRRAELNASEMAAKLRKTRKTITSWEYGKTEPGYLELLAWADACGVDPEELDPDIRSR